MRICSECYNIMFEGYCIDGGFDYYCSDECLENNMSREEFLELYDDGEGDTYYTEWELDEEPHPVTLEKYKKIVDKFWSDVIAEPDEKKACELRDFGMEHLMKIEIIDLEDLT